MDSSSQHTHELRATNCFCSGLSWTCPLTPWDVVGGTTLDTTTNEASGTSAGVQQSRTQPRLPSRGGGATKAGATLRSCDGAHIRKNSSALDLASMGGGEGGNGRVDTSATAAASSVRTDTNPTATTTTTSTPAAPASSSTTQQPNGAAGVGEGEGDEEEGSSMVARVAVGIPQDAAMRLCVDGAVVSVWFSCAAYTHCARLRIDYDGHTHSPIIAVRWCVSSYLEKPTADVTKYSMFDSRLEAVCLFDPKTKLDSGEGLTFALVRADGRDALPIPHDRRWCYVPHSCARAVCGAYFETAFDLIETLTAAVANTSLIDDVIGVGGNVSGAGGGASRPLPSGFSMSYSSPWASPSANPDTSTILSGGVGVSNAGSGAPTSNGATNNNASGGKGKTLAVDVGKTGGVGGDGGDSGGGGGGGDSDTSVLGGASDPDTSVYSCSGVGAKVSVVIDAAVAFGRSDLFWLEPNFCDGITAIPPETVCVLLRANIITRRETSGGGSDDAPPFSPGRVHDRQTSDTAAAESTVAFIAIAAGTNSQLGVRASLRGGGPSGVVVRCDTGEPLLSFLTAASLNEDVPAIDVVAVAVDFCSPYAALTAAAVEVSALSAHSPSPTTPSASPRASTNKRSGMGVSESSTTTHTSTTTAAAGSSATTLASLVSPDLYARAFSTSPLSKIGWCSWDAYGVSVDAAKVEAAVSALAAAGCAPGFAVLDDGWQSVTGAGQLNSFDADRDKFPAGLRALSDALGAHGTALHVWTTLLGYWGGVSADFAAILNLATVATPREDVAFCSGLQEAKTTGLHDWKRDYRIVHPDNAVSFFHRFAAALHACGVRGVKLDGQTLLELCSGHRAATATSGDGSSRFPSRDEAGTVVSRANTFAAAAVSAFGSLALQNSMCCSNETYLQPTSAVGTLRTSNDHAFPFKEETHEDVCQHAVRNAYNSVWLGLFGTVDWDMFRTSQWHGHLHGALRAVSGGPIYTSDAAGEFDTGLLRRLALHDGTIFPCCGPPRPTLDCLFVNPTQTRRLLKIVNTNPVGWVVLAANVQGPHAHEPIRERVTWGNVIGALSDAECGKISNSFVMASLINNTATVVDVESSGCVWDGVDVELHTTHFDVFTVMPTVAGGAFAPLGLDGFFNGGAAVRSVTAVATLTATTSIHSGGRGRGVVETRDELRVEGEGGESGVGGAGESGKYAEANVRRSYVVEVALERADGAAVFVAWAAAPPVAVHISTPHINRLVVPYDYYPTCSLVKVRLAALAGFGAAASDGGGPALAADCAPVTVYVHLGA